MSDGERLVGDLTLDWEAVPAGAVLQNTGVIKLVPYNTTLYLPQWGTGTLVNASTSCVGGAVSR